MGSLKSPCATSYRSSIDTVALNCLVFVIIAFFLHFGNKQTDRLTDRQTDKQMESSDALSRSRYCERRLKNLSQSLHEDDKLDVTSLHIFNKSRAIIRHFMIK